MLEFPLAEASPPDESRDRAGGGRSRVPLRGQGASGPAEAPSIGHPQLTDPVGEWGHSAGAPKCLPPAMPGGATSRLKVQAEDQDSPDGRPGGPGAHRPPHWWQH